VEFIKRPYKDWVILDVPEEVNYECNLSLKESIESLCKEGTKRICLDLSKVTFVGSSTLGIFCFAQKYLDNLEGKFCLMDPGAQIRDIMEGAGLAHIIRVVDDVSEIE
jgi:anti-anti-sigma factor